ncbi:MAG: CpsD/CapB family tyrosine-protein kinase [Clostridiales bacterium]|nr:MAG: CpsD/CapB family tyrosine-protein kinase [Clostridiales bacterium]
MNLKNATGFSNYLAGFAELDDVIQHCKNGLDVITSGQIPPNPSELLVSPRMEKGAFETFGKKYDYVIIDAPPVNIVSDAVSMSKFVTGVAVVVKEDFTTHDALKKSAFEP